MTIPPPKKPASPPPKPKWIPTGPNLFEKLNPDVVEDILEAVVRDRDAPHPKHFMARQFAMAVVCRFWRDIMLSRSAFWRAVYADGPSRAEPANMVRKRAHADAPLDLYLHKMAGMNVLEERWRGRNLYCTFSALDFAREMQKQFHRLEILELDDIDNSLFADIFETKEPTSIFHTLRLRESPLVVPSRIIGSSLKRLQLSRIEDGIPLSWLSTLFENATELEDLDLCEVNITPHGELWVNPPPRRGSSRNAEQPDLPRNPPPILLPLKYTVPAGRTARASLDRLRLRDTRPQQAVIELIQHCFPDTIELCPYVELREERIGAWDERALVQPVLRIQERDAPEHVEFTKPTAVITYADKSIRVFNMDFVLLVTDRGGFKEVLIDLLTRSRAMTFLGWDMQPLAWPGHFLCTPTWANVRHLTIDLSISLQDLKDTDWMYVKPRVNVPALERFTVRSRNQLGWATRQYSVDIYGRCVVKQIDQFTYPPTCVVEAVGTPSTDPAADKTRDPTTSEIRKAVEVAYLKKHKRSPWPAE